MSKVEPIERRKRELERAALAAACSGKLSERDGSGVEASVQTKLKYCIQPLGKDQIDPNK